MNSKQSNNSALGALDRFRKQAKALKKAVRAGEPAALGRLSAVLGDRADPDLADGHIGLLCALFDRKGVENILNRDPEAATRVSGRRTPILHLAFSRRHRAHPEKVADSLAIADLLLDHGAGIDDSMPANGHDESGEVWKLSVLYGALGHAGNVALARWLLERGANPDDNESFYHATELGNLDGVRLMMEFGATLNGTNAFFRMLDFDSFEGAKLMLEYGADPNECPTQWMVAAHRNQRGNALHHAIRRGRDGRFIALLLDAGADPMAEYLGHSAYALARIHGNRDAARALNGGGHATPLSESERFLAAIADGDVATVAALRPRANQLIAGLHPEEQELHIEAARMRDGFARLKGLIEAGFDPARLDRHEKITALHGAAWCGRADHVEYLLGFPQDLEHRNVYGANALGTAIHGSTNCPDAETGDYLRAVSLLIDAGVSINPDRGDLLMGTEAVTLLVEAALEERGR
jgi:ankyrin repeat protein